MEEKSYARYLKTSDGRLVPRYTAIDPADRAIRCTCGKPDCPRARLRPFREHIAELYRVLADIFQDQIADWNGVLYGLRMAASIEDVVADTGYVEDPMTYALCETTIDYDDAESEIASKYVAGATIFNFLWQAYEAAVACTAPLELSKLLKEARLGERGRRLFEARPGTSSKFLGLGEIIGLAFFQCQRGGLFDVRLGRLKERFTDRNLVTAAELCREFRNFLFHGKDQSPSHEGWGSATVSRCRLYRFYTISRLLLYLIQALASIELTDDLTLIREDDNAPVPCRTVLATLQFQEPAH
jgi:hypothetical protein